ncbi:hypothetical protein PEBR_05968 [Penicillium brasilianum]|uniref:Uncharacterized protein n=1 Tax=Penicillium brasilianum TaxID=104259 RepID=A0A1S9RXH3_PENBI|nr:hypothetical protein PEBR_05968 [Penicillium brasilianum]
MLGRLFSTNGVTVLVCLGTLVTYSEDAAKEMALALRTMLSRVFRAWGSEQWLQVLWKLPKQKGEQDGATTQSEVYTILQRETEADQVRIVDWLKVDPQSILQTGRVVLSVNHGGSSSFHEALWSFRSAGVPQVVLPPWADCYDFANRAEYLVISRWGNKSAKPRWKADELSSILVDVLLGPDAEAMKTRKLFVPDLFRTASQYGHESIVKLLLATFGPIGVGDTDVDDQTPLGWAAKNGHEEVVRVLLETGQVDINKELGWRKRTPFDYAMQNGHFGVAKLLFDAGRKDEALKDQKTQTFLHWAVSKRNEELVTFLLETGQVDVNARDDLGETPIFCALQAGYPKMAKLSLETGRVDACLASDQKPICLSQMKRLVNELL